MSHDEPIEEIVVWGDSGPSIDEGTVEGLKDFAGFMAKGNRIWEDIWANLAAGATAIAAGAAGTPVALKWAAVAAAALLNSSLQKMAAEFWEDVERDPPQDDYRRMVRVPPIQVSPPRIADPNLAFITDTALVLSRRLNRVNGLLDSLERAQAAQKAKDATWICIHGYTMTGMLHEYDNESHALIKILQEGAKHLATTDLDRVIDRDLIAEVRALPKNRSLRTEVDSLLRENGRSSADIRSFWRGLARTKLNPDQGGKLSEVFAKSAEMA